MIENPNEGLQVPENYLEVFTESLTTKPEPVAKYQFASYQHFGARPPLLCCIIRVGSFFEMARKKSAKASGFFLIGIQSIS